MEENITVRKTITGVLAKD